METPVVDLIEEFKSEDIIGSPLRSVNHSKLIGRICVVLDRYDADYDVLPELELELPTGKCKPDVAIYTKIGNDWFNDIIYYRRFSFIKGSSSRFKMFGRNRI